MSALSVRPAVLADAPLIMDFIRELAEYEKLLHEVKTSVDDIRRLMFGPTRVAEAVIAECEGAAVGYASFHPTLSTFLGSHGLWLEDLFVRQAWRGRGFGRDLLLHVARIAAERGCSRLEWSVLDWNEPALRFYRAMGAAPVEDWLRYRLDEAGIKALAEG